MPQIVEDRVDQVLRLVSGQQKETEQHLVRCLLAQVTRLGGEDGLDGLDAELSKMASTTSFVPAFKRIGCS